METTKDHHDVLEEFQRKHCDDNNPAMKEGNFLFCFDGATCYVGDGGIRPYDPPTDEIQFKQNILDYWKLRAYEALADFETARTGAMFTRPNADTLEDLKRRRKEVKHCQHGYLIAYDDCHHMFFPPEPRTPEREAYWDEIRAI